MTNTRPSPAIYGIETEYSCMIGFAGNITYELVGQCHSVDEQLGLYKEPESKGMEYVPEQSMKAALIAQGLYVNQNGMLSNGGRYYVDPSGPEYDTAEVTTAEEAVLRTFDGDAIVLAAFRFLQEEGAISSFQINRRVVDHNRSSRGIHLNTSTSLDLEPTPEVIAWLATLNLVKGAMFGSGGLLVDEMGETAFHHSPRLSITTDLDAQYRDYSLRPLVRHPFKTDGAPNRVETVTSDALNFAWPLRASMVLTNATTSLIEMGYGSDLPSVMNAKEKAAKVGQYGNGAILQLDKSGSEPTYVRPVDVIRQICELALSVDESQSHLDKESQQVLPEIIEVADKMTIDPYSVADQVESIGRLVAMERRMEKKGVALDSEALCRFDYAWDWVGGGIAEQLRQRGVVGWLGQSNSPSIIAAKKRMVTPPQDTRASLRGARIERKKGDDKSTWNTLDLGEGFMYVRPLDTQLPQTSMTQEPTATVAD